MTSRKIPRSLVVFLRKSGALFLKGTAKTAWEPCPPPRKRLEASGTKKMVQDDARFMDTFSNLTEKVADPISHKLHPLIEQYANLFKTGARTPVLRRLDIYGMQYEDAFFPAADGVTWKHGSSRRIRTSFRRMVNHSISISDLSSDAGAQALYGGISCFTNHARMRRA